jgi:hypothetical protein
MHDRAGPGGGGARTASAASAGGKHPIAPAPVDSASALSASLFQAQVALQAMMSSASRGVPGWWGDMQGNVALDAMKQQQQPENLSNPAQFNEALEMLEQAVAMARAAKAAEDLHAAAAGAVAPPSDAARRGIPQGAAGRAGGVKKEREVPGEREDMAAGAQCPRCFDLMSKPIAVFFNQAVCGPCAEALAAAPRAAGGFEGADGAGGVGGARGGEAGEAGEASGQHEKQMRNVLTEEGALRIFRCKEQHRTRDDLSERLAQEYGITPKAVRDIWNLRTWMNTTRHILKNTLYSAFM